MIFFLFLLPLISLCTAQEIVYMTLNVTDYLYSHQKKMWRPMRIQSRTVLISNIANTRINFTNNYTTRNYFYPSHCCLNNPIFKFFSECIYTSKVYYLSMLLFYKLKQFHFPRLPKLRATICLLEKCSLTLLLFQETNV